MDAESTCGNLARWSRVPIAFKDEFVSVSKQSKNQKDEKKSEGPKVRMLRRQSLRATLAFWQKGPLSKTK